MQNDKAKVIVIGDRYYCKHTKSRISTAWHLAGSKLYIPDDPKLNQTFDYLKEKGKNPQIWNVDLFPF